MKNGRKPHFGPFLALTGPILGPTKLFSALRPPLPLDITFLYHNLRNWQKLMHFEHGNGLKLYFDHKIRPIYEFVRTKMKKMRNILGQKSS